MSTYIDFLLHNAHLRSLCKNNRKSSILADQLTYTHTHAQCLCKSRAIWSSGHNLQRCIYPVTPSVLHRLCSHEMRVCDIWADSINITSVLYQFSSASSMRPDIAHRLACCDNLSSRPVHGGGEGYMCTDRDVSFSSFPSLRNEWMSASLSKIKSFPPSRY